MRHKDPELMKKISCCVEQFYSGRSRMPSTAEIAKELHMTEGAVKMRLERSRNKLWHFLGEEDLWHE